MRDVNTIDGIHVLKTMHSIKKRCIPRMQGTAYLDLYMLNKEKERLLKESEGLALRNTIIKKRLEEINLEINKLQEEEIILKDRGRSINSSGHTFTERNRIKKECKKMLLNY